LASEVEASRESNRYEGRELRGLDFRSFDRQSEALAVVTVRETWKDALYEYQGDGPSYDGEAISERGPYTLDATYTLERTEGRWLVTRAVYANQPPDWE
jgi:hypothetical protein